MSHTHLWQKSFGLIISFLILTALVPAHADELPPALLNAIESARPQVRAMQSANASASPTPLKAGKFHIGLIGDLPYDDEQVQKFDNLLTEMNKKDLAFVLHDGDIKSGDSLCSDALIHTRYAQINQSRYPLIYTPGDNEWTDCHRESAGGYDSLERLAFVRALFFPDAYSLGQEQISLIRQSVVPGYEKFVENVMWFRGDTLFISLHIVGSNNNLGRTPENDAEFAARNAANLDWLRSAFIAARLFDLNGVMLFIQANPLFEEALQACTGFNDFIDTLQEETLSFTKPVVLVHGDTHYFRIDKPLYDDEGLRIENFTRVETFGSPDVHWVQATINPKDPNVFSFEQIIVEDNRFDHFRE